MMTLFMFFSILLQKLTKLNWHHAYGLKFSVDDIALEAKKSPWLLSGMAVIGMHDYCRRKLSAAYGTRIVLLNQFGRDHFRGKPSTSETIVICHSFADIRVFLVALFHHVSGAFSRFLALRVGSTLRDGLGSHVNFSPSFLPIRSRVVLAPSLPTPLLSFWRRVLGFESVKDTFAIFSVILTRVLAVTLGILNTRCTRLRTYFVPIRRHPLFLVRQSSGDINRPFFWRAFRFYLGHPGILSEGFLSLNASLGA